jgi:putative phosphoribosyl transferase
MENRPHPRAPQASPPSYGNLRREVRIPIKGQLLDGDFVIPADALGIVLFAHGSGSSRHSPRNKYVARYLQDAKLGTLLFDLLTPQEETVDAVTGRLRFDVTLLADRLVQATHWLHHQPEAYDLRVGYFGASTGGGAALVAAATLGDQVNAVVSRGGRPDLAGPALPKVTAPTLLIVGGHDAAVLRLNEAALRELRCTKELKVVAGATHLFEEPGTLERVAEHARNWFHEHLRAAP